MNARMEMKDKTIRLQVYLARCGIGSRRKCEEFIQGNRVSVNGEIANTPGFKVSASDIVLFDNRRIVPEEKKIYIAIHKPPRYLCSNADNRNMPLVSELFKNRIKERLFHAGRLDFLSSGLIFYTNDGDFAYNITHPSFEIEKEYIVKTAKGVNASMLEKYQHGILVDGETYIVKSYEIKTPFLIHLVLNEGKNREIRKVFSHFRIPLKKIHRIRIGIISLGNMKPGDFRYLTEKEVNWFKTSRFSDM